ncbi:hypothetical protein MKW94_012354 [Papaver nudicaule]|uniref:Bifunctional inhibitor/plant lipid transfer protein/seed storage helical domain-containing protein n=1 Tax=Papaver nudicaule TaxID=74823 RepID=A0AA41S0V5_PAPNU|nr:hypothetical protein [Papaver nudicaule]
MVKISLFLCVLAIFACATVVNSKTAPAPAVDCSTIIFSMADCLTFVTSGSKVTKPEGACCPGLKTVLKTDAQCICEAFKNSGSLGIVLDIKKAMTLPAACGVSAPSIDKCGLALTLSPGGAPAQSPTRSIALPPTSSGTTSLAPASAPAQDTTTGSSQVAAPAPAPSAASTSTISSLALLVSLVAASYSLFEISSITI